MADDVTADRRAEIQGHGNHGISFAGGVPIMWGGEQN